MTLSGQEDTSKTFDIFYCVKIAELVEIQVNYD